MDSIKKIFHTWGFSNHRLNLIELEPCLFFEFVEKNVDESLAKPSDVLTKPHERIYLSLRALKWLLKNIEIVLLNGITKEQTFNPYNLFGPDINHVCKFEFSNNTEPMYYLKRYIDGSQIGQFMFNESDMNKLHQLGQDILDKYFKYLEEIPD